MKNSASAETHGVSSVVDPPVISEIGGDAKLSRGGIAWAIFEGGRDPYVILMTIYIFISVHYSCIVCSISIFYHRC